jgi:hypothetical protein
MSHSCGRLIRLACMLFIATTACWIAFSISERRWRPTADPASGSSPGDEIVDDPDWTMDLAIDIDAGREHVWPWLLQIGFQRGGLYSYDWLDRVFGILDGPSADEILQEYQNLQPGDVIPLGAGPSWPVAEVIKERALVLVPDAGDVLVSWAFVLEPLNGHRTRLVSKVRAAYQPTWLNRLMFGLMRPAAFLMTRKMLLGIRDRAERSP